MLLEGRLEAARGSCGAAAAACLPASQPARHATLFDRLQGHAMPSKSHLLLANMNLLAGRQTPDVPTCSSVMVRVRILLSFGDFEILPYARLLSPPPTFGFLLGSA